MTNSDKSFDPLEVQASLDSVSITITTHWWGFELHLNESAVQLLEDIRDLLGKLTKLLDPDLAPIIKVAILLEKLWIKAVDRGNGVKLVSPWISPAMLIPFPEDETVHIDDNSLYWSVFDRNRGWSPSHKFPANFAEVGPAAVCFQDRLICVHRGANDNTNLLWTTYSPSHGWQRDIRFPAQVTSAEPALAVFNDRLYCVHQGASQNGSLWYTSFDGEHWSYDSQMPGISSGGVALAEFNGRLYCVHRGAQQDEHMYLTVYDGENWSRLERLPFYSTSKPALVVFQNRLLCLYRRSDSDIGCYRFDGNQWNFSTTLGAITADGPAVVAHQDVLYCVYRGDASDEHLYYCYLGSDSNDDWSNPHRMPAKSYDTPALLFYHDPNGRRDHIMCIYRGYES